MDNFYCHTEKIENVMKQFSSCPNGINDEVARKRLYEHGQNVLIEKKPAI